MDLKFSGGIQNFGSVNAIHVAGTFAGIYTVSSWIWFVTPSASSTRYTTHAFEAGVQVVGPPAYNQVNGRLYVAVHDHNQQTKRFIIYQFAFSSDGFMESASVLLTETYNEVNPTLRSLVPVIPGMSVRRDTGALSLVDEQDRTIQVFLCTTYEHQALVDSMSTVPCSELGSSYSTPYNAAYKDMEFVGGPGMSPSKLFLVSMELINAVRAELYVQCAKCGGGGITETDTEALSEEDCFCRQGFCIVTSPERGCESCVCKDGQYLNTMQSSEQQCATGRELSMPGCLPCSATCSSGEYMQGFWDGTQTSNNMSRAFCNQYLATVEMPVSCPAASTLPVARTASTVIQSASAFH
jgi:hypothetical protein